MPRSRRNFPDRAPQHVVNRGNRKTRIFWTDVDYLGFLAAMADAAERTVVRLVAFCLMPNHFHLVLWPYKGSDISIYMQVLMNSHLRHLMRHHDLAGKGHVYQGRFRPHLIRNEQHFLNVCRYVESNPVRSHLTTRAEDWPWTSLVCDGPAPGINLVAPWPIAKPRDWIAQVNAPAVALPVSKGSPLAKGWLAP